MVFLYCNYFSLICLIFFGDIVFQNFFFTNEVVNYETKKKILSTQSLFIWVYVCRPTMNMLIIYYTYNNMCSAVFDKRILRNSLQTSISSRFIIVLDTCNFIGRLSIFSISFINTQIVCTIPKNISTSPQIFSKKKNTLWHAK